jgi:hypothetical protein
MRDRQPGAERDRGQCPRRLLEEKRRTGAQLQRQQRRQRTAAQDAEEGPAPEAG